MTQVTSAHDFQPTPFQRTIAKMLTYEIGDNWKLSRVLDATEEVRTSLGLESDVVQAAISGASEVVVLIDGAILRGGRGLEGAQAPEDVASLHDKFAAEEDARSYRAEYRADAFLKKGVEHMQDRAEQYDSPEGKRSMESAVAAFNAITGCDLTESEGWTFMQVLKLVRANQGGPFNPDHYEDLAAYAGLHGESAAAHQRRLLAEHAA